MIDRCLATATAVALATAATAAAHESGANRMMFFFDDAQAGVSDGMVINQTAVNGFEIMVAGDFGFGPGDEVFLLNRDGANRVAVRDDGGAWSTADSFTADPRAVNGFELMVSGDFAPATGDEIFLLNANGVNRTLVQEGERWVVADQLAIEQAGVNGYTIAVAGDFASNPGDEIFLVNREGSNRTLIREEEGGPWRVADAMALDPASVNGYDYAVSGDFLPGGGDEILLLGQGGSNRFLVPDGEGQWIVADQTGIDPAAVNGFDQALAGDFGFGEGDEILLLGPEGRNRLMIRQAAQGTWVDVESAELPAALVEGYTMAVSGQFMGEGPASVFLLR